VGQTLPKNRGGKAGGSFIGHKSFGPAPQLAMPGHGNGGLTAAGVLPEYRAEKLQAVGGAIRGGIAAAASFSTMNGGSGDCGKKGDGFGETVRRRLNHNSDTRGQMGDSCNTVAANTPKAKQIFVGSIGVFMLKPW